LLRERNNDELAAGAFRRRHRVERLRKWLFKIYGVARS